MRKRIISMLLLASIVFSSVSVTPVFAANESAVEQTEQKELYTVGNISYENGAGTTKGNGHDCQQLGIWIPANTTFRIRQTNLDLKQNLTIRMRNDDKQTEAIYTIPANGDWLEITPTADSVPFISSIYRSDGQKPAVEFSMAGAKKLPVYTKGGDEKTFFKEWDDSDAPFAVYESEYAIFLVPKCDKKANKLGTLNDLCQYYDNMIRQYNEFAGLSKSEDTEVWNKDSGTRYFIKANKHGAGAAYYSVIETATNSASMAGYMEYNWGSLHEVGHGYNTIGFNSAEIWNNVFGYYYQMATLGKSTWLGMTEQNRAGYEKERQANGYDGNDYGTKLYFWVNMFDKIGPRQAISYSYQKYRSNRYHGITSLTGYTYYADAFAEATGYNVFTYFELWGRPVDEIAKQNTIQAGVYKNVYPLRNLTQTDETADKIKGQLGLSSRYDLVETEALVSGKTDVTGTLNVQLDDASYAALKGNEVKITDGVNTVKTIAINDPTLKIPLSIGVYNVLVDKGDVNDGTLFEHLIGDAVIVEGETTDYQITSTAANSEEFVVNTIIFKGYADVKFFTAVLNMEDRTLKLTTENGQPHRTIDGLYSTIEVLNQENERIYYKAHYGKVADPEDTTIKIEEGYKIKIYHMEPSNRLVVCSSVTPEIIVSPGTRNSEYEVTAYGLKRVPSNATDGQEMYFDLVCQYMDDLIKANQTADFQNSNKLQQEKAKVKSAYTKLDKNYQKRFQEKYKGYYPFDQGVQQVSIEDIPDQTFTGEELKPELIVSENGENLTKDVDYTVTYLNNINIGTAKAIVYGMGDHAALYGEKTFQISLPEEKKVFEVTSTVPSYSYTGGAKRPEAIVKYNGKVLRKGIDYNLFHINNTDVGTATITATGIGNYKGFYGEGTFTITGQIVELRVSCSPQKIVYTGEPREVSVSVEVNNRTLTEGKDFQIEKYENNTEAGTASVYVKGIGNYEGSSGIGTFEITKPQEIVPTNGDEFSNWEIDMNGYGYAGRFSHIIFDIKNNMLQIDTKQSTPHSLINGLYAYITVYDTKGSQVYHKEYIGNQQYPADSVSIPMGLGYIVEVYHKEPGRGKVYASKNTSVTIPMTQLAKYEITATGIQKVDTAKEDPMSVYYANVAASMDALIQDHPKEDFKDETKFAEEKSKIEQALANLSSEKLELFKETYKDYYPFHAVEVEYRVSYDWGMEYPSDQILPEDFNVYSSEEEAMKAMDTTYTNNSSVRGSKDDKTGVWRFSGWSGSCDETTHIVTYLGTWIFEEDKTMTITYRVENGTWDGENAEDKTEIVTLTDGKGYAQNIPSGMLPNEGYKGGEWNTDPTTEIRGDVTFIYSFTQKEEEPEIKTVTVTFKIENGTWSDQSTDDIVKEIKLVDGVSTLVSDEIPANMIPNEGYINGSWNVDPTTKIRGDVTFIYSFTKSEEEPEPRIVTVRFKVENGIWADQSTEDIVKEVALTDGVGTLVSDEIPSGMVPNEGYEGGAWNIDPATEISGDITFIYSFTQKKEEPEARIVTVTFKVENGTWENQSTDDIEKKVELVDGVGTLASDEIPLGMIPNEGYEGGAWNIDPITEIRGDITFIYSFTQKKEEPKPEPEPEPEPDPEPEPQPEPTPEPEPTPQPEPEPVPQPELQPEIQPEQDKKDDAVSTSSSGKSHTSHHSDSGETETQITDSQNETTNDTEQNVMETANENTVVSEIASTPVIPDQPEEQAVEELSDQSIEEVAEEEPSEEPVEEVAEEESSDIQENAQDQQAKIVSQKDNWGLFVLVAAVCAAIFLAGGFILYKKRREK